VDRIAHILVNQLKLLLGNRVGDACFIDSDRYFWYQGRTNDMIITSGYNVASAQVEGALLQHPAVLECGVIGSPDEMRGEIVKAFVVLNDGYFPSQALARSLQSMSRLRSHPISILAPSNSAHPCHGPKPANFNVLDFVNLASGGPRNKKINRGQLEYVLL